MTAKTTSFARTPNLLFFFFFSLLHFVSFSIPSRNHVFHQFRIVSLSSPSIWSVYDLLPCTIYCIFLPIALAVSQFRFLTNFLHIFSLSYCYSYLLLLFLRFHSPSSYFDRMSHKIYTLHDPKSVHVYQTFSIHSIFLHRRLMCITFNVCVLNSLRYIHNDLLHMLFLFQPLIFITFYIRRSLPLSVCAAKIIMYWIETLNQEK